jgi:hypothetical protein
MKWCVKIKKMVFVENDLARHAAKVSQKITTTKSSFNNLRWDFAVPSALSVG